MGVLDSYSSDTHLLLNSAKMEKGGKTGDDKESLQNIHKRFHSYLFKNQDYFRQCFKTLFFNALITSQRNVIL